MLELQRAFDLSAAFRFAGRKPGGDLRRNRLTLNASPRAQGAYPPAMPRLPVIAVDHPGNHVFPCAPEYLQHIAMRRAGVIVKEFDPPIALAADFSSGLQNGLLQHLAAADRLDCAYEAVAAMGVTQSAFAPLLLGCEHALHRAEFGDRVIVKSVYSVERHSPYLRAARVARSALAHHERGGWS